MRVRTGAVLAGGVAVVAAIAAAIVWARWHPGNEVPVSMRTVLDARVVAVAEQKNADMCTALGPGVTCSVTCTAHVFGMEPRTASTADEVTTAYTRLSCQDHDSEGIDSAFEMPVAVMFGPPASIQAPADDGLHPDIADIFPARLRAVAQTYY